MKVIIPRSPSTPHSIPSWPWQVIYACGPQLLHLEGEERPPHHPLKLCSNLRTRAHLDVRWRCDSRLWLTQHHGHGQSCPDTQVDMGSAGPYLGCTHSYRVHEARATSEPTFPPTILFASATPGSLGTLMSSFLPLPLFGICAFFKARILCLAFQQALLQSSPGSQIPSRYPSVPGGATAERTRQPHVQINKLSQG